VHLALGVSGNCRSALTVATALRASSRLVSACSVALDGDTADSPVRASK
jgi:hypothetical protein